MGILYVNGEKYVALLKDFLIPKPREMNLHRVAWFQQDEGYLTHLKNKHDPFTKVFSREVDIEMGKCQLATTIT